MGLQISGQQSGAEGLPLATSTGLSVPTVGLHHSPEDVGIGQLGTGHVGDMLHVEDAGLEGKVGLAVISESGSGDIVTGEGLPPPVELPDLDLLGEEGEGGTRKEKRSE